MKLLADENIPLASVRGLRDLGHDVLSIAEQSPGISDEEVLRLSRTEGRVIVTFDRDFGKLVFGRRLPAPVGILYLRFVPRSPLEVTDYVSRLLDQNIQLERRITSADRGGIRQRPFGRGGLTGVPVR